MYVPCDPLNHNLRLPYLQYIFKKLSSQMCAVNYQHESPFNFASLDEDSVSSNPFLKPFYLLHCLVVRSFVGSLGTVQTLPIFYPQKLISTVF